MMNTSLASVRAGLHLARTRWQRWAAGPERQRRRREWGALSTGRPADAAATDPDGLGRQGFSPARLDPALTAALLADWHALVSTSALAPTGTGKRSTGKAFFKEWLDDASLSRHPAFIRTALAPAVLASVARAMGQVPHLESVDILESIPGTGEPAASQLWHYDVNDERILKLFVYLEDCGPANGPFTFIEAATSQKVSSAVGHYVPDDLIANHVPRSQWKTVEGPAGTAFLIDTGRCYHFGSRCAVRRVAYVATYSSGLKFMPRSGLWPGLLRGSELDPLQRAVCSLEN